MRMKRTSVEELSLTRLSNSRPSSFGILISVTTTSNNSRSSNSRACCPSPAVTTSCPWPDRSSARVTRLIFSSSTTKILMGVHRRGIVRRCRRPGCHPSRLPLRRKAGSRSGCQLPRLGGEPESRPEQVRAVPAGIPAVFGRLAVPELRGLVPAYLSPSRIAEVTNWKRDYVGIAPVLYRVPNQSADN